MTLTTICDTAAIYGPCAYSFGMEPWHAAVPMLFDLAFGHLPPMMPLISGAMADVKAEAESFSIDMKLA